MKRRNTRQKEIIAKIIPLFESFFTAEELYAKVTKKYPSIGIATIYRMLTTLVNEHALHTYTCNRRTIYSIERKSHCHFICEKCGKFTHFDIRSLDFMKKNIPGSICHFQIDVTGICKKCLQSKTPDKEKY